MSDWGEDQYPWWLNEPQEAYDEYDRVHAYDDGQPEPDFEPDYDPHYIRPDEDAIMDRYEAQFYGA